MSRCKRSICHWCVRVNCQIEDNKGTQMMLLLFSWCYYTHTTRYCDNCYCWLPCISYMQWKVQYFFSNMSPCRCVLCTSIHTVEPDVLLKYSIAKVVGGSWMECSWCLRLSDHQKCTTFSCGTPCVWRGTTLFSTSSTNKSKNFVTVMEKSLACHSFKKYGEFWKEETTCVWKTCVSSLVHAWIKGHVRKLILLRTYYASGCVDTSLTQDLFW